MNKIKKMIQKKIIKGGKYCGNKKRKKKAQVNVNKKVKNRCMNK